VVTKSTDPDVLETAGTGLSSEGFVYDAHLINAALDIFRDDPAFGYRFIADELREHGIAAGENRVARLWSQKRAGRSFAKKRGLTRKADPPVHDDLVDRVFTAAAPNACG
jgi:putative transposase